MFIKNVHKKCSYKIILSIHTTHNFVKLLSSKPNDSLTKVIKELTSFNELINI